MLCVLCFTMGANAQKQISFDAVAANVDGLPKKILTVDVNKDGQEGPGATLQGTYFAKQSWDIYSLSEDFNFHDELVAPLGSYFQVAEHGGKVSDLSNSTDGLGLLLRKNGTGSFTEMARVAWEQHYGETDHGADGLINKGFRRFAVTLATGFTIDVYALHMDAETDPKDIAARESQIIQLADYIKDNNSNRPILVIGDTNCRYTRDKLKENFIDAINATDSMTAKDAWVEIVRGGNYPTYSETGEGALMVGTLGSRKGEVVDKVLYINMHNAPLQLQANSYERNDKIGWASDHYPVVVNFTLTNTDEEDETEAIFEERWTVDAPTFQAPAIKGATPSNGAKGYFLNVETKKYIAADGAYGHRAMMASDGHYFTLDLSGEKYRLGTYNNTHCLRNEATPYLDEGTTHYGYTFEQADAINNYYRIKNDAGYLTAVSDANSVGGVKDLVNAVALNESNKAQQWIFLDEATMKEQMQNYSGTFDCTPLIPTSDFDRGDYWLPSATDNTVLSSWTISGGTLSHGQAQWIADDAGRNSVNYAIGATGDEAITFTKTLTGMPAGKYLFEYQAFYGCEEHSYTKKIVGGTTDNGTSFIDLANSTISFGGTTKDLKQNNSTIGAVDAAAVTFRDTETYADDITVTPTATQDLTITITKPAKTDESAPSLRGDYSTYESWIAFDKFKLSYTPNSVEDPTLQHRATVANKINEAWQAVAAQGETAMESYDIRTVLYLYNNGYVVDPNTAQDLVNMINDASNNAIAADKTETIKNTVNNAINAGGGDITAVIDNHSFEEGDVTGWTLTTSGGDTGVRENTGNWSTSNTDGTYLFNTWISDIDLGSTRISQTIGSLPSGLYEVRALLTSFPGYRTWLIGNNRHQGVETSDKSLFTETKLLFLVEDGEAFIGAVGANGTEATDYKYYYPTMGAFFKADDFHLAYVCDVPHGRLKIAIDKANEEAAKFDEYGKAAFNISQYETIYANKSLSGDGKAEVTAINNILNTAAKAQKTANANMTQAIVNPSFETGDITGWTTDTTTVVNGTQAYGDVGARLQDNGTYTAVKAEGTYLYNSWIAEEGAVAPLTQTVTNLPQGKYRLDVMLSTDGNAEGQSKVLYAAANGVSTTVAPLQKDKMVPATVEFEVGADGKANITVCASDVNGTVNVSTGGVWYKADDFRLTYLGRDLTLNETATSNDGVGGWYTSATLTRSIPAGKWSTLVLPYTMPVPETLTAQEFTGATQSGNTVSVTFTEATQFEQGKAYMVKPTGTDAVTLPVATNVDVNMTAPTTDLGAAQIQPTYVAISIPQGTYFLNNNKFYYAKDTSNTSKGYRAYITLTDASASNVISLDDLFGDEGTTGIDGVQTESTEIIGIYSVTGVSRAALEKGVNIIKMSNGKTKKVYVK